MTIGERIKELRKKNDLTQEKLADYLCVSYQAVSKWECGVSSPDLSLIGPLTKVLHVSADELLGLTNEKADHKNREWEDEYKDTWKTGDIEKRLEVCRSVVHDHPGDMKWMYRLAMVLDMHCYSWGNKDRYDSGRAEAIRYYSTVIEHTDDATLRENAVAAIVQALSYSGRKEEARKYIDLYPKERQGDLLGYCLEGDEKIAHRQRKIKRAFENFISLLSFYDPYEVQLMGELIKTVIPDGNYLDDLYCMYCYEMGRAKKPWRKTVLTTPFSHLSMQKRMRLQKTGSNTTNPVSTDIQLHCLIKS